MTNNTERLPPHQALVAIFAMNVVLWGVFYALWCAGCAVIEMVRTLLP